MKRILIITALSIVCIFGIYATINWCRNNPETKNFMCPRCRDVITQFLAKMGVAEAQYRMGYYWLYCKINPLLVEVDAVPVEEMKTTLENAIYWWERASAKGSKKAKTGLAKAKELLLCDDEKIIEFFIQ